MSRPSFQEATLNDSDRYEGEALHHLSVQNFQTALVFAVLSLTNAVRANVKPE